MYNCNNAILTIAVEDFKPGIPQLAAVMNKGFGMYRAFFPQANRIILHRTARLSKLVKEQYEFDANDAAHSDEERLHTFETGNDDNDKARLKLEQQIEKELNKHCMIKSI